MTKLWQDARRLGCGREPPIARVRSLVSQFGSRLLLPGKSPQSTSITPAKRSPSQPIGPQPNNSGSLSNPTVVVKPELPIDFGKEVVGGWPGVTGPVRIGIPVVDRNKEVIVVYRETKGGALKSKIGRISRAEE
ncbi:MAG: hypothetical protein Q7S22_01740 [Candidatus Micrarchaeota archaeon]|nr:hypothetical protein [Candidatus Micrarchaeota archaeon]